jgi:hypothetical protein
MADNVEIITHNPNETLDLTSKVEEDVSTENTDVIEGESTVVNTDDSTDESSTEDKSTDKSTDESPDKSSTEDDKSDKDEDKDDKTSEDDSDAPEYFFGEEQVHIEVPDEISAALTEAGIDEKELLSQLFKKDGDFSIDDETRSKLEDKFGATMVNGYLNMYKGINEQNVAKFQKDAAAVLETEKAQGEAYSTAVGGEEGLVAMEGYIVDSFEPEQIEAYNALMENGDHSSQLLIISQVKKMMELQDKLENGDSNVKLIGDKDASNSGISTPMDKGYITAAEYDAIMLEDKYWEDSAYGQKVDAARMAGFKHDA